MRFLGRLARFWVLLTFSASTGYFWLHNQDRMPLNVPPWLDHVSIPSWMAYSVFFLIGVVITLFALSLEVIGKSMEIRRLKKALKAAKGSPRSWDDRSGSDDSLILSRPASALSATGGSGVSTLS